MNRLVLLSSLLMVMVGCPTSQSEFEIGQDDPVLEARPDIVVSPGSLVFGGAAAGAVQTLPATIENRGTALLFLNEVVVQGGPFELVGGHPATIDPGTEIELTIQRTANDQEDVGWLTVRSDDPDEREIVVDLFGETLTAQLELDPPVIDFGAVQVGSSKTLFIDVTSVGEVPADFSGLQHQAVFEYQPPPLPLLLPPGQTVKVAVRFTPPNPILYGDVLRAQGDVLPSVTPVQIKGRGYVAGLGSGGLIGRICDPSGNGFVVGATVWVEDGGVVVQTTTDEDGLFTLNGLTDGPQTIHVTKGSWSVEYIAEVVAGAVMALPDDLCLEGTDVVVGVVPGDYDSIEVLVNTLGIDFEVVNNPHSLLSDPAELERFDVLFFNCSEGEFGTSAINTANLRDWVSLGGRLYTSDYAFWVHEQILPNSLDFLGDDNDRYGPALGAPGWVYSDILDPAMQGVVGGATAGIAYDLGAWMQVDSSLAATVLVQGVPPAGSGSFHMQPLVVRQEVGSGLVIFTTFHNEAQVTADMRALLYEMILSL